MAQKPKSARKPRASSKATAPATPAEQANTAPIAAKADTLPPLKMPDLMRILSEESDLKRPELRKIVDTVMGCLAGALEEGRDVKLAGFGKLTPKKRIEKPGGDLIVTRIKLFSQAPDQKDGPDSPENRD